MRLTHILVPTDFGESSGQAEVLALDLAAQSGAKITLLHVWSVPIPSYAEGLTWPIDALEGAARNGLAEAHARLVTKHPATEAVLTAGLTWERILETAKDRGVDLIVMGTHGRRGLPRWFLGSVAEKVVRLSPVPVLTVGAADSRGEPVQRRSRSDS
jgi:nucleotide-binding universal stress UspA family protein